MENALFGVCYGSKVPWDHTVSKTTMTAIGKLDLTNFWFVHTTELPKQNPKGEASSMNSLSL